MRASARGLRRFIVTPEVAKHRPFAFVDDPTTVPDASLYVIGSDDAWLLGVCSSRVHVVWSLAAGGRMGKGNDPRYQNGPCFDPFPFPVGSELVNARIRKLGEDLDAHRKQQQAAHPTLTITGMYNVLEKLRSGEPLSAKDKAIHEQGLISVLRQLHDDLDNAVLDAYGWPRDLSDEQILERVVALNHERAEEEQRGLVRWLRPDFQNPTGKPTATQTELPDTDTDSDAPDTATGARGSASSAPGSAGATPAAANAAPWPKKLPEQIRAVRDLTTRSAAEWSSAQVAATFKAAREKDVQPVLESLTALGLLIAYGPDDARRYRSARG